MYYEFLTAISSPNSCLALFMRLKMSALEPTLLCIILHSKQNDSTSSKHWFCTDSLCSLLQFIFIALVFPMFIFRPACNAVAWSTENLICMSKNVWESRQISTALSESSYLLWRPQMIPFLKQLTLFSTTSSIQLNKRLGKTQTFGITELMLVFVT